MAGLRLAPPAPHPGERKRTVFTRPSLAKLLVAITLVLSFDVLAVEPACYPLEVLPAEHKQTTDPETGAELIYLTTDPADDWNLHWSVRAWLADDSLILFETARDGGGIMGYLVETGELVRIHTPEGRLDDATAAINRNSVYARRGDEILELALEFDVSSEPENEPSEVFAQERLIARLPAHEDGRPTRLTENSDSTTLAIGVRNVPVDGDDGAVIYTIDIASGALEELCRLRHPPGHPGGGNHVQWSFTNPYLLSFAGRVGPDSDVAGPRRGSADPTDYENRWQKLWVVDVREGVPRNVYEAAEGELVTHPAWWVDDQKLFTGGTRQEPPVESHVKAVNIYTGHARVMGAGAWWPHGDPEELTRHSWWHTSGSEDGRWIVADNFHGDIMLFEGATTRPHMLTRNHRTYGRGRHCHPGWDNRGKQVVFASDRLGSQNVCVAAVPGALQEQAAYAANNPSGLSEPPPDE